MLDSRETSQPDVADSAAPAGDPDRESCLAGPGLRPGAILWIRQQRWIVEQISLERGIIRVDVAGRHERRAFLLPFDRAQAPDPRRRAKRVRLRRACARCAWLVARRSSFRLPVALLDARIGLLPYQIAPALASLAGWRRLLVADDVGLGKTIQAAMLVAELVRRDGGARVLLVVPKTLQAQWADELGRRFRLGTASIDRQSLAGHARAGALRESPWMRPGIWLVSIDYLKQAHVLATIPERPWDLVVVDEAHDVCGDTDRHEACDAMGRRARRLVLLTATPHSGDEARFDRLTCLGRLPSEKDDLLVFRRTQQDAGLDLGRRTCWRRLALTPTHRRVLDALLAFEAQVLRRAEPSGHAAILLLSVFRKRALSTMSALAATLARRLAILDRAGTDALDPWRQAPLPFSADDVGEDEHALEADSGLPRDHERRWLERLRRLALVAVDSRVSHVRRLLSRTREPVVIFTEFRHSLEALERQLSGCRVLAAMHGGQSPAEHAEALARFVSGRATVLLATDVAGQGLNLQHAARWVVSVDLPWNPLKLEQRIGRVERIGQRRRVHLTLLLARHPAEERLLSHVLRRVLTARRSLGDQALARAIPPSEAAVAAALIAGEPLHPSPPDALRDSGLRWMRAARAVSRVLSRRRVLMAHWRAPQPIIGRPWIASRPSDHRNALLLVSVSLLDDTGAEVEQLLVPLRFDGDNSTPPDLLLRSGVDLMPLYARRVRARIRRLERLTREVAAREVGTELAIAAESARARTHAPFALSLFDRAGERAFEDDRRRQHAQQADVAARLDLLRRALALGVAAARIELVLRPIR
ncbi:MAG: DEAD/DEAH box helicase family protein [Acidobacteria bacterium]|nr:DEAD/DEAH box helicase family protein [Acidobacteriota bacterium]